jgi:hypothetical protein
MHVQNNYKQWVLFPSNVFLSLSNVHQSFSILLEFFKIMINFHKKYLKFVKFIFATHLNAFGSNLLLTLH